MNACGVTDVSVCLGAPKCSYEMPLIYTDPLPPYYSDFIWCAKLATTLSEYAATFECFVACVTTVISTYNAYVWKLKCGTLYLCNIETIYVSFITRSFLVYSL